jgi:hypothetical protein
MGRRRSVPVPVVAVGVAAVLALAGCSARSAPGVSGTAAPSATSGSSGSSESSGSSARASGDAATCAAVGDVLTVARNADAGLRDGRMALQEQQGWYRLAARVLALAPSSGEGDVSDALAALKDIAPATAPGAMGIAAIGTAEWDAGLADLAKACTAAGTEVTVQMFTGG